MMCIVLADTDSNYFKNGGESSADIAPFFVRDGNHRAAREWEAADRGSAEPAHPGDGV